MNGTIPILRPYVVQLCMRLNHALLLSEMIQNLYQLILDGRSSQRDCRKGLPFRCCSHAMMCSSWGVCSDCACHKQPLVCGVHENSHLFGGRALRFLTEAVYTSSNLRPSKVQVVNRLGWLVQIQSLCARSGSPKMPFIRLLV